MKRPFSFLATQFYRIQRHPEIRLVLACLCAAALFSLALLVPLPVNFTSRFASITPATFIYIVLIFSLAVSLRGCPGFTAGLGVLVVIMAAALTYLRQSAAMDWYMIGGLLPLSDAQAYYFSALRLLQGMPFSVFTTRRPMFSGLLATLLTVFGGDLRAVLAFLSLVNVLALFLLFWEIKELHGRWTGIALGVLLALYYLDYNGKVLTENLGFALGCFATAVLLRSARQNTYPAFLAGIFFMAVAQNARSGALLVLPAALVWGFFHPGWRDKRKQFIVGAAAAVGAGFALNFALAKIVGSTDGQLFSNYSHTLYGLASGNTGWQQIIADYPGVPESEYMKLALAQIAANPALLLQGMLGAFGDFFRPYSGAFSFLGLHMPFSMLTNAYLWGLTLFGLLPILRRLRQPVYQLELVLFLGVMLSTFIVPPRDAGMRPYAATMPSILLLLALNFERQQPGADAAGSPLVRTRSLLALPALLVFCTAVLPLGLFFFARPAGAGALPVCLPGQQPLVMDISKGALLRLVGPGGAFASGGFYGPDVDIFAFQRSIVESPKEGEALEQFLLHLRQGQMLALGLNLADRAANGTLNPAADVLIVGSDQQIHAGLLKACGTALDPAHSRFYPGIYRLGN